jgi:DNA repair protein RadC
MDKKDEVNEEVHYSNIKKLQHDYSGKNSQTDNKFNDLRKDSQAIDKDNTHKNTEIKNKGNVIKIDVNHTQSKSNVKPLYKKSETKNPFLNPQIKTVNKKQEFKRPDYWGHRERLRNRFREGLLKGFTDYEVLELLLFYTINKIDTKPIAYNLINEFGSIEKVFTQTYERLLSVIQKDIRPSKQECEKSAFLIKFIRNLAILLWKRGINNRLEAKEKIIKNGSELLAYLKNQYNNYLEADMRDLSYEQFRVIFLDSRNKILKDEVMFEGTINQTGVYPRQILKRALELNATAIIAVHNHPGGSLKPSNADISVTRTLQSACDNLGISLLDHLIIGDKFCNGEDQEKSFYSFAENGLL